MTLHLLWARPASLERKQAEEEAERGARCSWADSPSRVLIDGRSFYPAQHLGLVYVVSLHRLSSDLLRPSFGGRAGDSGRLPPVRVGSFFDSVLRNVILPRDSGLTGWFSHSKARGSSAPCMRWQDFQAQAVSPTCFVLLRRISNVTHVMFDWELRRCGRRKRRSEEEEEEE